MQGCQSPLPLRSSPRCFGPFPPPLEISTSINIVPRVSISRMPAIKTESRLLPPPQLRSPTAGGGEELFFSFPEKLCPRRSYTRVFEKIAEFSLKSPGGRAEPNPGLVGYKLASFPAILRLICRSVGGVTAETIISVSAAEEKEREREGGREKDGY